MASSADVFTTDLTLTQISIDRGRNRYIADEVFNVFDTMEKTALISRRDPTETGLIDGSFERAPGAEAKVADITIDRPITMNAIDHALRGYVPDEHKAINNPAIKASIDKVEELRDRLLLNKEIAAVANLTTNMTGAQTSVPGTRWDATGGTPIDDIMAQMSVIEANYGVTPNMLALDVLVLRSIARQETFVAELRNTLVPAFDVIAQQLASLCGLDEVLVTDICRKNTAVQGQTAVIARVWNQNVLLFHREPAGIRTSNFAQTFTWSTADAQGEGGIQDGWRVETWRESARRSDGVIVSRYYDQKILDSQAGHLFTTVLT